MFRVTWIFLVAFALFTGVTGLYESIEDITNNLATDLAPLITLFGEQVTKQFLSESTSFKDSIIFSIAPLGLITAVVSVIRIYGSSSLKSIIGRSQEAHGVAEAELCSSTSQDVCELWSNGGICRVLGCPKILHFIYNSNANDFYPKYKKVQGAHVFEDGPSCGIHRPTTKKALSGWEEVESSQRTWPKLELSKLLWRIFGLEPIKPHVIKIFDFTEDERSASPNLTLNIGIRKHHKIIHWSILIFSVLLQLGFFGYAAWATFYNPSFLNKGTPSPQARVWFGLTILGTIMLVFGMILCARLVDLKSYERRFKRIGGAAEFFWLQPGGQRIGDQLFYAFAYSERKDEYITSKRVDNTNREPMLLLTVVSTTLGWVLQFVGLRGSPGSIALFQFIGTLIMSLLRATLRGKRLGADKNRLGNYKYHGRDLVEGHELDSQAMNFDEDNRHCVRQWCVSDYFPNEDQDDIREEIHKGVSVVATKHFIACYTTDDARIAHTANYAVRWIAEQEAINPEPPHYVASEEAQDALASQREQSDIPHTTCLNPAAKIMRYRLRLAELTSVQFGMPPEQAWGGEIRTTALQLQKALQVSAEYIFAQFPLNQAWKNNLAPKAIAWMSSCWFSKSLHQTSKEEFLPVGFQMHNRDGKWSVSSYQLEAVLALWMWSLKWSEFLLSPTALEELVQSKMIVVEKSKREDIREALYLWVTQTQKVREYEAVRHMSRSDNLSIPTSLLLRTARRPEQSSGAPGQAHTPNTDGFTILGIPTNGSTSLLQFMAQDVYTVFINKIVDIVSNLRGTGDPEDYLTMPDHFLSTASRATPLFGFTNPHIDALANALVSVGIATREEALMSIVPAFLRQRKLPLLDEDMVQNLLDWAKSLRRDLKFRQGAALLTWILSRCPTGFLRQGLRCLGDLYRRAALSKKRGDREFGLREMRSMRQRHPALASNRKTHGIQDILNCYEHLYDFLRGQTPPKTPYTNSNGRLDIEPEVSSLTQFSGRRLSSGLIEEEKILEWKKDLEWALTWNKRFYCPSEPSQDLERLRLELLKWAIGRNFPELIEDLWISARSPQEKYGSLQLRIALDQECELETFHSLLDWPGVGVDDNVSESGRDDCSKTLLVCAIEADRADVVRSILRRGAYLHQRDELGMTPLHHAARKSNETIIQLLLEKGAEICEKDGTGQTPLHLAATRLNGEGVARLLLKNGAGVHQTDDEGRTPLHISAQNGHQRVLRLLLEKSAEDELVMGGHHCGLLSGTAMKE